MTKKILVVEDSRSQRLFLKKMLEDQGYRVFEAENGVAAEKVLESESIESIVLDWELPDILGIDLLKKWQETLEDFIPVVMLTSHTSEKKIKLALDSGAIDFVSKPPNQIELLARINCALRIKDLHFKLREASIKDPLTHIFNRRYFDEFLSKEIKRTKRHGNPLTFALLDIDFFKKVNDTYGHDMGDLILTQMADLLTEVKRDTDILARLGGEEFGVLLTETTNEQALLFMERVRKKCEQTKWGTKFKVLRVSFSCGIAQLDTSAENPIESLYKRADTALYKAKDMGRNQVVVEAS